MFAPDQNLWTANKLIPAVVLFFLTVLVWGCATHQSAVKVSTLNRNFSTQVLTGKKVLILPFYNTTDTKNITLEKILENICRAKFGKTRWVTEKYLEDVRKNMEETLIKIEPFKKLDLFISEYKKTGKINKKDFPNAFPRKITFILAASLEPGNLASAPNQDYPFKGGLQIWRVFPKEKVYDCFFQGKVSYDDFNDYSNSFSEAKTIVYKQFIVQALNKIPVPAKKIPRHPRDW